jgi:hypothetical protein
MNEEIKIEIGYQSVVIDKLFGSKIFMNLRITPIIEDCSWKIERLTLIPTSNDEQTHESTWIEFCRIPGQFEWEFLKND